MLAVSLPWKKESVVFSVDRRKASRNNDTWKKRGKRKTSKAHYHQLRQPSGLLLRPAVWASFLCNSQRGKMHNSQRAVFSFLLITLSIWILDGKSNCESRSSQNFLEVAYRSSLSWWGGGREKEGVSSPPVCLSTVIRCLWSRSGGLAVGWHGHIRQEWIAMCQAWHSEARDTASFLIWSKTLEGRGEMFRAKLDHCFGFVVGLFVFYLPLSFSLCLNFCSKETNKRNRSGLTKRRIDGMRTTSNHLLWRTTKILTHFSNPTIPCFRNVPGAPFILSPLRSQSLRDFPFFLSSSIKSLIPFFAPLLMTAEAQTSHGCFLLRPCDWA